MPIWGYYKPVITHICKKCNIFMQYLILTMLFVYVIIREEKVWGVLYFFDAAAKFSAAVLKKGVPLSSFPTRKSLE